MIMERCSFWYDTTHTEFEGENELKVLERVRRLRGLDILKKE